MEISSRILVLSLGGALGVNARYWATAAIERWAGTRFPWATFTINVSGAFLIGLAATLLARRDPHSPARLMLITGFLGGYTTFSTYALEAMTLWGRARPGASLAYALGSVAAGVLAVTLGVIAARADLASWPAQASADAPTPSVEGQGEGPVATR